MGKNVQVIRLVGIRHTVMNLQVAFGDGLSFLVCVDLSHAGKGYSVVEKNRTGTLECIVDGV